MCIRFCHFVLFFFFFQAEDGIRDDLVTGVQTCALPISFLDYWGLGDKETVPLPQRTTWGKSLVCQGCGNMIRGVSKRPPVKTPMEPVGCELEISYLLTQGN